MSTMNISLPDTLKSFVDEQVSQRGDSDDHRLRLQPDAEGLRDPVLHLTR